MSWSDHLRRGALAVALSALVLGAAGCNVRPLHGTVAGTPDVRSELAAIDVAPVQGRVGQVVRNELLFLLNGNQPAPTRYSMSMSVVQSASGVIVRQLGGQPQGRTMSVQIAYTLSEPGVQRPLLTGSVTRFASYEWTNQRFANDRAELDALERAGREAAEEIRMRLSAFFASGRRLGPQRSPDIAPTVDGLTVF